MASTKRPVVLFGIDGATYAVLDPLIAEAKLPNLARLKREGAYGTLQSTIHPLTPAAWVSMVTGLNPGKHGVFDFRRRKTASYDWELVNSRSWSGEPIWSFLGRQGRKVGVFNVPMTYPPLPVNGFLVAGLGTPPQSQKFIYPDSLAVEFHKCFPTYAVEPDVRTSDLDEYLNRNEDSLDQHLQALRFLWQQYPDLDFFMPVLIESDRVHHVFWRFLDPNMAGYDEPEAAGFRERIGALYQKIDALVGELWAWVADRGGTIVVVSDHGFGPLLKDVHINKWLIGEGYLVLKSEAASRTAGAFFDSVDWAKTRAYSFGFFGNINLNLHGREPNGLVEPGREAEKLKGEIASKLRQLTDPETGERIVDSVYRKEELYFGLYLDQAPDLLVVMKDYAYMTRDGFDFNSVNLIGPPMEHNQDALAHSGNHRLEGILLMAGEGIRAGYEIQGGNITDVAPTALYLAGLPVPTGLDGKVLLSAFDQAFTTARPPAYTAPASNGLGAEKPAKLRLLEKEVQISLLDEEIKKLRRVIAEKDHTIRDLEDVIQRFKNGKMMRLLAWLQSVRRGS